MRAAWRENKKRVEVQVVLDVSGSMEDEQRLVQAKAALTNFIGQLADEDSLGITIFNSDITELTPLDPIGPKRQEVLIRVNGLFATGGTRLINATSQAYRQMQQRPRGERIRAIVVLSDGADNESVESRESLIDLLSADVEGYSIKVFTIAYSTGGDVDIDLLTTIAEASGAKTY